MKGSSVFFRAAAILCIAAGLCFAQGGKLPKIAVYVVGEIGESEKRALGTEMLNALVRSGRYTAVERAEEFVALIDKEHIAQRSGTVDDSEISALGKQFGVEYICVADAAGAFGAHQVSARILNVETAEVMFVERANGNLDNIQALVSLSNTIVSNMFGIVKTASEALRDDKGGPKKPKVIKDPMTGIEMVSVMGGTFKMGCSEEKWKKCNALATPVHSVTLSDFYIGKHEITQKQWIQVMGKNPTPKKKNRIFVYKGDAAQKQWVQALTQAMGQKKADKFIKNASKSDKKGEAFDYNSIGDDIPVTHVSWDDVQAFIAKLNAMTGKKYRLPTEAEWEYAARGGAWSKGYLYAGSNDLNELGGSAVAYPSPVFPVGVWPPNELGVHDMTGSVAEWVNDLYGKYGTSSQTDPKGPETKEKMRIVRGFKFYVNALKPQEGIEVLANRQPWSPGGMVSRSGGFGFRLALDQ